jgi:hypothetical protein
LGSLEIVFWHDKGFPDFPLDAFSNLTKIELFFFHEQDEVKIDNAWVDNARVLFQRLQKASPSLESLKLGKRFRHEIYVDPPRPSIGRCFRVTSYSHLQVPLMQPPPPRSAPIRPRGPCYTHNLLPKALPESHFSYLGRLHGVRIRDRTNRLARTARFQRPLNLHAR